MPDDLNLGVYFCPVCGVAHETGAVLLHKRFQKVMNRQTAASFDFCPEHRRMYEQGFTALVEVSNGGPETSLTPETANRTGRIAHLRHHLVAEIFQIPKQDQMGREWKLLYVDAQVMDMLENMQREADAQGAPQ